MIHSFLGLCTTDSSSWILLFSLSRRLMHSCLWEQQHFFLLIPAFNPSNPPTVPWFTSYIPLSGFQSSSPTFSFNSYLRCFPILCKDQTHRFPASPLCLILISVLCSSVAWKARCPCSLCAKQFTGASRTFPAIKLLEWPAADFQLILQTSWGVKVNTIPLSLNGLESDISPLYQKANVCLMSLTGAFVQGSICLLLDCCGMKKEPQKQ